MTEECKIKKGSTWGLALAWYPDYTDGKTDPFAKMKFLERYGMKAFTLTYEEIEEMDEASRETLFERIAESGFTVSPHISTNHIFDERIDTNQANEIIIEQIEKYTKLLNSHIITSTPGPSHRYDRVMPFEEKIRIFSDALTPIAKACKDVGAPFAIENHADYYVSEIVDIIIATPGMYLFFDTANALHIGEQPVKAALDAAPYTIGTHFKDHLMVRGDHGPVHYIVSGCALGEGDAELTKVYELLMQKCPNKDRLVMFFELFKGDGPAIDCFEKSVRFVRHLQDSYGT